MATESEKIIGTNTPDEKLEQEPKEPTTAELAEQIRKLTSENEKLRQANTNASADASKWKKQYQEKLSEEDRRKEQEEEQNATLRQELETLRAERNVANHKSQLLSIGFDDALAQEMAENLNGGDVAKVFDGLRRFVVAHDKQLKETAFRQNPTLTGGSVGGKPVSKEEFEKMGYRERVEVFNQYPDLYNEYTK